jgi:hypothetical protein
VAKDALDLAGLPPKKLAEVRRRTAVISEYARLQRPTRALAEAYAARLGIRLAYFYLLVRLFRETGSIVRAGPQLSGNVKLKLDARTDAAITAAIEAAGADAALVDVVRAASACCDALNIPRPSETAVRTRLRRARRQGSGSQSHPPLVLDRSALGLNIETPDGPKAIWLTALLHAHAGKVLGYHLSIGAAGPREAALAVVDALQGRGGLPTELAGGPIELVRDYNAGWPSLASALAEAGLAVVGAIKERPRNGRAFYRLFGDQLGRVTIRPRLHMNLAARDGGPGVDFADAKALLDQVLAGLLVPLNERAMPHQLTGLAEALRPLVDAGA